MKNNLDLLQVSEVVNDDVYLTSDASKIKEDNDGMKISDKEEKNTV